MLEYSYKINKLLGKSAIVMTLGDVLKDFISGCVSGWTQVLVMQPFEIVKVRLINQSSSKPEYSGIFDCFRKIRK